MKLKTIKIVLTLIVILIGLVIGTVTIFASGPEKQFSDSTSNFNKESNVLKNESFGGLVFRTILSFSLVVIVIIIVMFGLRWLSARTGRGNELTKQMRVHGSIPLGPKKSLYLVQVINRVLVLGITDSNVSLLSEITDEKEVKALLELSGETSSKMHQSFATHLATFTGKFKS